MLKCVAAMATWNRAEITKQCIESYIATCEPELVDLHIVDNGSTDGLAEWLRSQERRFSDFGISVTYNSENVGTAKAINSVWAERSPDQHCLKIDSDVVWKTPKWLSKMLEVFDFTSNVGIVGLKRPDLLENPDNPDPFYRSNLVSLVRDSDNKKIVIEQVWHVIGTCWLVRNTVINIVGALVQPTVYGFDDALYCLRTHLAKFATVFLPRDVVEIDHIDYGEARNDENAEYTRWKRAVATSDMPSYEHLRDKFMRGEIPIYVPFRSKMPASSLSNNKEARDLIREFGEDFFYGY